MSPATDWRLIAFGGRDQLWPLLRLPAVTVDARGSWRYLPIDAHRPQSSGRL
jgi:hypothetical protein